MKINSEKFKKDFVEKKASHGMDEAAKNQFLREFYGKEPAYNKHKGLGPEKISQDVLDQVNKIADHISKLGLTKFSALKEKFKASEYSERPMSQVMMIKEHMEAILFVIETGDRKKEDIVKQFKDRYFACSDGTLTNLQGILAEMVMDGNKVENYVTLQKKELMEQVALDVLRENRAPEFKESTRGNEIHDVSSLLNSVSDEYNIVKKTRAEDIHVKDKLSTATRDLFAGEIEKKLQDPNANDAFIDGVARRIQANLPYYDVSKEEFFTELYSALDELGLKGIIDPTALIKYGVDENNEGKILGYKDNVHSVLRDAITLHLHNTGVIQAPNIKEVETRIAIENSTNVMGDLNRVSEEVLSEAKANGMLEYAAKYIYENGVKLDEEDFPDMNIAKYLVSELGAQASLKVALEAGFAIEDINYCIDKGAKIEANTGVDLSLSLLINIKNGNKEVVKLLLEGGADPNAKDDKGESALELAAGAKHIEIAQMLLKKGASIDLKTPDVSELLLLSVKANHPEIMDANIVQYLVSDFGAQQALKVALESGLSTEDILYCLEQGAELKASAGIDLNLALLINVKKGNAEIAGLLLESGADPNTKDAQSKTALELAAAGGHIETVEMLLQKGITIDWKTPYGNKVLLLAIKAGQSETVAMLLKTVIYKSWGSDWNTSKQKDALEFAVGEGHTEIVRMLLKQKGVSKHKDSAFRLAIDGDNAEIVTILLEEEKAYIDEKLLDHAIQGGNTEIIKAILRVKGENPSLERALRKVTTAAIEKGDKDKVKFLIDNALYVDSDDKVEIANLLMANDADVNQKVKMLLQKGATVDWKTPYGNTALLLAIKAGQSEIVAMLLETVTYIGWHSEWKGDEQKDALKLAISEGHAEIVKMLLKKGVSIDTDGVFRDSTLKLAIDGGHAEIVTILLEKRSYIDKELLIHAIQGGNKEIIKTILSVKGEVNPSLDKALREVVADAIEKGDKDKIKFLIDNGLYIGNADFLRLAIQGDKVEIAKLLIANGADVQQMYKYYGRPLDMVVANGNIEMAKLLIEAGALVNKKDEHYNSPLHMALKSRHVKKEMVKLLVENGADVNSLAQSHETPLSLAVGGGNVEVFNYLLLNGANTEAVRNIGSKPENILEIALLRYANADSFKKALKSYKSLQNSVSEALTDGLREGLNSGKYKDVDSFIAAFTTNLGDMSNQPEFRRKFVERIKGFSETKADIKLGFWEEFKAGVIGTFVKNTTIEREMEIAKLNKHLDRFYNIVQNHEEFKALTAGIQDMLKMEISGLQAGRGGVAR